MYRMRNTLLMVVAGALLTASCSAGGNDSASMTTITTVAAAATTTTVAAETTSTAFHAEGAFFQVLDSRKIIQTAQLELVADDTETAFATITREVTRAGGFIASADVERPEGDDERPYIDVTVRVPSTEMSGLLQRMEAAADEVRSKQIGTQDVTGEYADTQAQLRNLRALETEMLDLLAKVEERANAKPDDILDVFAEIRSVRGEIERLEGRSQLLDDLVALATIDVTLTPTPTAVTEPIVDEFDTTSTAEDAARSLVDALQGIFAVAIWVGILLVPLTALFAIPAGTVWWLRRRRRAASPA